MDVLRRDVTKVDFIDPGTQPHIMLHPGNSCDVICLKKGVRSQLRGGPGTSPESLAPQPAQPLPVDLLHFLHDFKQSRPS